MCSMSKPKTKNVRMPGFDLEDGLFDKLEQIRLETGMTWRAMLSKGVELLIQREADNQKNGGDEV